MSFKFPLAQLKLSEAHVATIDVRKRKERLPTRRPNFITAEVLDKATKLEVNQSCIVEKKCRLTIMTLMNHREKPHMKDKKFSCAQVTKETTKITRLC